MSTPNDERQLDVYLMRHGQTAWSASGRHTGRTDIPLTDIGRADAAKLGPVLKPIHFELVLTSPLQRARTTCELAGFGDVARIDDDLAEWDYGRYEGITTSEIHATNPGWNVFDDGAPDGETPAEVTARVDRVIDRIAGFDGNVALFAHGHLLRCLTARWVGESIAFGKCLLLDTGTLSRLGHYRDDRAIHTWNAEVRGKR